MMKGKRTLSLAMSLIALCGALSACSEDYTYPDSKWTEGQIVTVAGHQYTFDDIYKAFEGTKNSAQSYYSVAKSVLAQLVTPRTDSIKVNVSSKVDKLHDTWKENARTNGTSYKEEQEKTFDSEGVENEEQLVEKYYAQQQVDENTNAFTTVNKGVTNPDEEYYISEQYTKDYVTRNAPYHVSHILVKVDASSSGEGYWNGNISADNAKHIGNVVRMLSVGQSFGSVAQLSSDDNSNVNYGELYVEKQQVAMEKTTSYINEFKLGVYAYDAFLNPETKNDDDVKLSLRVPGKAIDGKDLLPEYKDDTSVADAIDDTLVGKGQAFGIPVSKAFQIQYLADTESNPENGKQVDYATATQYPRNILFNNYFNYHGVNFIYDDTAEWEAEFLAECQVINPAVSSIADLENALPNKFKEYNYIKNRMDNLSDDAFQTVGEIGNNLYGYRSTIAGSQVSTTLTPIAAGKRILTTASNHQPIIVVRGGTAGESGYQGIHFIIVNKNPFEDKANTYKYYRVNIPQENSSNPAKSTDYATNPSFINFVTADANSNTTYNKRKETLQDAIKASDFNIEFSRFRANEDKFAKTYNKSFKDYVGAELYEKINKYITTTIASSTDDRAETLDSSWETYINSLNVQVEVATARMLPTVCVAYFEYGEYTNSTQEDICHVKK